MRRIGLCLIVAGLAPALLVAQEEQEPEYTERFPLDRCQFVPWGGNAYFSLQAGRQTQLSNNQCVQDGECEELEDVTISVTRELKKISMEIAGRKRSIWTRVIEEHETVDGELAEISRNFFAACWPTNDVYYFGEEVDIYENGEVVSHDGAWLAGQDGALPGIIMPESAFILGQRYFQEVAPGVALDRAEHVGAGLEAAVPAGTFDDCVEIDETTPLEPDSVSTKVYCPGVGLVADEELEAIVIFAPRRALDFDEDGDWSD